MLFFAGFVIVGGILSYVFMVRPLSGLLSARQWPTVTCTVISSEVKSHSGDDGRTYSVNILYSYVFDDREYQANRYDFMGGSSSGLAGKQAIVARYSAGSKAVCHVNPKDPTQAVLERGFTPMMWVGLLPLLFFFAGLVGMCSVLRTRRAQSLSVGLQNEGFSLQDSWNAGAAASDTVTSGTLILKPQASPLAKVLVTIGIALFWNGIVSVFLFQVFKSWRSGHFEWFLALFLTPFVLIGLGFFVAIAYFFLALFNPRPRLMITPGVPRLGDSLRVEWEVAGRVEVLRNLRLRLEGREEATYTRGTTTSTDRSVFANLEISTETAPQEMRSGGRALTIPRGLMHSFSAKHNKIVWSIHIAGEIDRWPDLTEEFPLTVLPAAQRSRQPL